VVVSVVCAKVGVWLLSSRWRSTVPTPPRTRPSGPRRCTMFRRRRHQRRVHRHAGPRGQRVPPRL